MASVDSVVVFNDPFLVAIPESDEPSLLDRGAEKFVVADWPVGLRGGHTLGLYEPVGEWISLREIWSPQNSPNRSTAGPQRRAILGFTDTSTMQL